MVRTVLLILLLPAQVLAQDVVIAAPNTVVNVAAALTRSVAAGAVQLEIAGATFDPGQRVLVVQTQDPLLTQSTTGDTVDLIATRVGRFEFGRVALSFGNTVTLEGALSQDFEAPGAQVVSVAEYDSLTIVDGGSLDTLPWDGARGGVLALSVKGALINEGVVSASGRGFRGGGVLGDVVLAADGGACLELEGFAPFYSGAGEGVVVASYQRTTRAELYGGGGAGACLFGGGGGGSNAGAGGPGGSHPSAATGNFGQGARPLMSALLRLVPGGGGGGGHFAVSYATASASGAAGGGVIVVDAERIEGQGLWLANGANPSGFGGGDWGYGGGGAGGTVWLRARTRLGCGRVEARGGQGGTGSNWKGPGGGGGGGRMVLEATEPANCPGEASGGACGLSGNGITLGAGPSSGVVPPWLGEILTVAPPMDVTDGGSAGLLRFVTSPNGLAYCGVPYRYSVQLTPKLEPSGPTTFSVAAQGDAPIPAGLSVDGVSGEFTWRPTTPQAGLQHFVLVAESAGQRVEQPMDVSVECERPHTVNVGCSSTPWVLAWSALLLLVRRRSLRSR